MEDNLILMSGEPLKKYVSCIQLGVFKLLIRKISALVGSVLKFFDKIECIK